MTTDYHTPIPLSPKQPARAATINSPLAELDAELVSQNSDLSALDVRMTTQESHSAASANVHGLPADVNVLGNRSAAGEFIQRGAVPSMTTGNTAYQIYYAQTIVTFPVAFTSAPKVVGAGATDPISHVPLMGVTDITTTTFRLSIESVGAGSVTYTDCNWIALGA